MLRNMFKYLFINKTIRQTVIKNISWLLCSDIIIRALKFFLIPYSSYILGVTQFGSFYYFISLCTAFYLFADLGLSANFNREYNQEKRLDKKAISISIFFYTRIISISICFLLSLSLLISYWHSPMFKNIFLMLLVTCLDNYAKIFIAILNTQKRNEIYAIISTISNGVLVALGIIALKVTGSLFFYIAAYLFYSTLTLTSFAIFFKN